MAKNKKARNDARGYQQQQQAPKLQMVEVQAATQAQLDDLLANVVVAPRAAPPSTERSDRFVKRLASVVEQLADIGFDDHAIDKVVRALGYALTLETALDWLCLQLSSAELPPILTEGAVRQETTKSSSSTVEVVAAVPRTEPVERRVEERLILPAVPETGREDDVNDEDDRARHKEWLLAQYAYEDDDDDERVDDSVDETEAEPVQTMEPPPEIEAESNVVDSSVPDEASADQVALCQAQNELAAVEADLGDEASNYLRSKPEIKALQKQAKDLRKYVQRLEQKVEREQRKQQVTKKVASGDIEVEEEGGGGFVDLFIEDATATAAPADHSPPITPTLVIPEDAIPKNWTGKTPMVLLNEHCRKQKLKPVFTKLSGHGCRLNIKGDESLVVERRGPISSYADAKHYVATEVLYRLNSNLPLYRVLPPYYRDLWVGWMAAAQAAKDNERQVAKDQRQERIDALLRIIEESSKGSAPEIVTLSATQEEADNVVSTVAESWEDLDDNQAGVVEKQVGDDTQDKRLRDFFRRRQKSSSYQQMLQQRSQLPMYSYRDQLLQTIAANPVTIVCAETGAGKTTQCGQFLLEDALLDGRGSRMSILCTQPRRVAATSVAERVADEMCEHDIGGLVGYQIRLESRRSAETKLLFCTTGIVLRRLVEDPTLDGVSHVIIDEVHERQWQIDVLLVALRKLLQGKRPDLKVILMSATLDAELFCSFFGGAPLVSVPGRTFPVASYYLEDLLDETGHIIEEGSRHAGRAYDNRETASMYITMKGGEKREEIVSLDSELDVELTDDFIGYSLATRRSLDRVDETVINYDLIEDVLQLILLDGVQLQHKLLPPNAADRSKGSVLIFLPGIGEIRTLADRLCNSRLFARSDAFEIVPLHSSLSSNEQKRAFRVPSNGCRKIIIATNIAETSVTIPDVTCVIDSGRVRELQTDKRTSTSKLIPTWCSRASTKQRAGRAGRVQPGLCLKLFSTRTERQVMKAVTEPELQRIPLEEVCLNILAAGFASNCRQFLSQAPQPPPDIAVAAALESLRVVGAVTLPATDQSRSVSEQLTSLGRHLAKLPVSARVGKMLIFGALFRCIDPILTIAATLSASRSPFMASMANDALAKAKHSSFRHPESDFMTMVNAFNAYRSSEKTGKSSKFCRDNYLNYAVLREISEARRQFADLLASIGFLSRTESAQTQQENGSIPLATANMYGDKEIVVHCVVFSGMYPYIAQLVKGSKGSMYLMHKTERLELHSSSVNAKLPAHRAGKWLSFHEKFGTVNRVSVSVTCFVDPFSIMLFGSTIDVKHFERIVRVDDWIELRAAAKTGVTVREIRKQVESLLKGVIENVGADLDSSGQGLQAATITGIVKLLESSSSSS